MRHQVARSKASERGGSRGRELALAVVPALLLALLLLAAFVPIAQASTRYPETIRFGRAEARALLTTSGASSISLALVAGDRIVWRQTFGYADVAARRAPGPGTMYGIGSVSKVITAAAVMKLVDEGRVDLDAPVARYVPSFHMLSPDYADITVRMLLDHSSGLPGSTFTNWSTAEYFPGYQQQVLDSLATQWLKATPGAWSVYCNDGFTLAELVVQSVTGENFAQYVEDEVFAPLGMRHSTYPLQPFADGSYAHSYDGGVLLPREAVELLASGGVYSTPTDMTRLARMLMHGGALNGVRLLSRRAVAEMATDQTTGTFDPTPSSMMRFGLGWDTVTEPALGRAGVTAWAKNGGSAQYGGSLVVAPKAKLAIMVSGAPVVTAYLDALGREVLLHALREQGTIARFPRKAPTTAPAPVRATRAQLESMTGYWANMSTVIHITPTAGHPQALTVATLVSGEWAEVGTTFRLRTDGRFHLDGKPTGYRLKRAGNHTYLDCTFAGLDGYSATRLLWYQKLAARTPLGDAWQRRDGGTWLAVNEQPDSSAYDPSRPTLRVASVPGLPGYVAVSVPAYGGSAIVDASQGDDVARLFLQIPGNFGRDQEDLFVLTRGGEEWTRWAATLYRPLATVPALPAGANSVTIGTEGYAEWRTVEDAVTLRIGGASAWYLYDRDFTTIVAKGDGEPADAGAPAGALLVVFGPAAADVSVGVTPVE